MNWKKLVFEVDVCDRSRSPTHLNSDSLATPALNIIYLKTLKHSTKNRLLQHEHQIQTTFPQQKKNWKLEKRKFLFPQQFTWWKSIFRNTFHLNSIQSFELCMHSISYRYSISVFPYNFSSILIRFPRCIFQIQYPKVEASLFSQTFLKKTVNRKEENVMYINKIFLCILREIFWI